MNPYDLKRQQYLGWLLCIIVLYIPVFSHLDSLPMQLWDESRLACKSAEINQSGNWLVMTFMHSPDLWSVKPPLYLWISAAFMKILGVNELAARLPAAIAAASTMLLLYWFCAYKLKNVFWGVGAVVVLICSKGYMTLHGIRTGDYDSLLTFFTTFYCLHFFLYLETFQRKNLILFTIGAALAIMTKSIAGCLMLPGLLLYAILSGKLFQILRKGEVYLSVVMVFVPVLIYYFFREQAAPGYLQAVWENELGARYSTVIEGHYGSLDYYVRLFILERLPDFYLFIPIAAIAGIFAKDKYIRQMMIFIITTAGSYLLIISNATTKIPWYDLPLYPFWSIAVAFIFVLLNQLLRNITKETYLREAIIPVVIIFFCCAKPYIQQNYESMAPVGCCEDPAAADMARYMQQLLKGKIPADSITIGQKRNLPQNLYFYYLALNAKGIKTTFAGEKEIAPGMELAVWEPELKEEIERQYDCTPLFQENALIIYKIDSVKKLPIVDSSTTK